MAEQLLEQGKASVTVLGEIACTDAMPVAAGADIAVQAAGYLMSLVDEEALKTWGLPKEQQHPHLATAALRFLNRQPL